MNWYNGTGFLLLIFLSRFALAEPDVVQIAVLNLESFGVEKNTVLALSDRLRNELVETGTYRVIERNKMNAILEEQGFQQSGCTSDECAVEIGKILNINQICAGSVARVGSIYTVSLRMIDVGNGEIITSLTEDCECPIEALLTETMPKLAKRMVADRLPPPPLQQGTLNLLNRADGMKILLNDEPVLQDEYPKIVAAGNHRLKVYQSGFETLSRRVDINTGEHLEIEIQMKPKTTTKALLRSLFVPGWGQHYQEKGLTGFAINIFFLGSAGAAILLDGKMSDETAEYQNIRNAYESAYTSDQIERYRVAMDRQFEEIEELETQRNLAIGVSGMIWVWGILDAWLVKPGYESRYAFSIDQSTGYSEIRFCFHF